MGEMLHHQEEESLNLIHRQKHWYAQRESIRWVALQKLVPYVTALEDHLFLRF